MEHMHTGGSKYCYGQGQAVVQVRDSQETNLDSKLDQVPEHLECPATNVFL